MDLIKLTPHQQLLMQLRDTFCGGNAAALARKINKNPTYVNRLFYPVDKKGSKGIGLEIMTACNKAFSLPPGYWDGLTDLDLSDDTVSYTNFDDTPANSTQTLLAWNYELALPTCEFVKIPQLKVTTLVSDNNSIVSTELSKLECKAFSAGWLRATRLNPSKLGYHLADDNSMEPRIWAGDHLIVDTAQTSVIDGKVFALSYNGRTRVKRLFGRPCGGLRLSSDNSAFETIDLASANVHQVSILGRVIRVEGEGGL